jgi:PKD repeat protein
LLAANNDGCCIQNAGTMTLNQCTMSENLSENNNGGEGIFNEGTLTILNSIVAGNNGDGGAGSDILNINNSYGVTYPGLLTFEGANIVQYVSNSGTIIGSTPITNAPNLAPLGNYGGPTQTLPPLPGSPAIAAGCVAANTFAADQRGFPRTQNGLIDIGAVELPTLQFTASPTNGFQPLTVQFNCPNVDSDGSAITQWNWNFGDNNTSTDQNPSDTYATVGSFTPSFIVTNDLGLAVPGSGPSIITVSQPVITGISLSGANLMINGTNAISGLTYYVLTSTNLALPFSQWTPMATDTWSANGSFNLTVTNTVNPSVPQQFYMLQVP